MPSLNKAEIIGHLGKDPEVRTMQNGNRVMSFSVATSEHWKDKQTQEKKEATEWHNVVIFNDNKIKFAEVCGLKKGDLVRVEGKIKTRKWEDQQGATKYTTEIVVENFSGDLMVFNSKDSASGGGATASPSQEPEDHFEDDVPF